MKARIGTEAQGDDGSTGSHFGSLFLDKRGLGLGQLTGMVKSGLGVLLKTASINMQYLSWLSLSV